jgi:cobalamin biosynthesis protein CbiG
MRGTGNRDRIIAGVGFRSDADAEEIKELILRTLSTHGADMEDLCTIAVADFKRDAGELHKISQEWRVPLTFVSDNAIADVATRCLTASDATRHRTGHGASLAEAAALAAAGVNAPLLAPRSKSARATCALARMARRVIPGEPT